MTGADKNTIDGLIGDVDSHIPRCYDLSVGKLPPRTGKLPKHMLEQKMAPESLRKLYSHDRKQIRLAASVLNAMLNSGVTSIPLDAARIDRLVNHDPNLSDDPEDYIPKKRGRPKKFQSFKRDPLISAGDDGVKRSNRYIFRETVATLTYLGMEYTKPLHQKTHGFLHLKKDSKMREGEFAFATDEWIDKCRTRAVKGLDVASEAEERQDPVKSTPRKEPEQKVSEQKAKTKQQQKRDVGLGAQPYRPGSVAAPSVDLTDEQPESQEHVEAPSVPEILFALESAHESVIQDAALSIESGTFETFSFGQYFKPIIASIVGGRLAPLARMTAADVRARLGKSVTKRHASEIIERVANRIEEVGSLADLTALNPSAVKVVEDFVCQSYVESKAKYIAEDAAKSGLSPSEQRGVVEAQMRSMWEDHLSQCRETTISSLRGWAPSVLQDAVDDLASYTPKSESDQEYCKLIITNAILGFDMQSWFVSIVEQVYQNPRILGGDLAAWIDEKVSETDGALYRMVTRSGVVSQDCLRTINVLPAAEHCQTA